MTQAELDALIAALGGEVGGPGAGRRVDPRTAKRPRTVQTEFGPVEVEGFDEPNLTPDWIIETAKGTIKVQPQPDGTYLPINIPNVPKESTARGQPGQAPVSLGNGLFWTADQGVVEIPGTVREPSPERTPAPRLIEETGEWVGFDPTSNTIRSYGFDAGVRERQRIADDATAAKAQIDRMLALNTISKAEADAAKAEWDQYWKQNVEFPQKLQAEEDVLRTNALTYGRQAGENAVSDITATLPYRYSPGFTARRGAALQAATTGNYRQALRSPPIAQGYRMPDLAGTRAQAQASAGGGYLGAFGFDPGEIARSIPYTGPAATPTAAPAVMDDDDYLRELARRFV